MEEEKNEEQEEKLEEQPEEQKAAPEQDDKDDPEKHPVRHYIRHHRALVTILVIVMVVDALLGAAYGYVHSKYELLQYTEGKFDNEVSAESTSEDKATAEDVESRADSSDLAEAATVQAEGDIFSDSDVYNLLLIGTDDRTTKFSDNARGDSCISMSINRRTKKIHLISFERAMGVPILGGDYEGQYDWLTHTFRYGGPYLMTQEIRENFRVDVDKFIRINIRSLIELVDCAGGVDLMLTREEADNINHPEGTYSAGYIRGMHVEDTVQQDLHPGLNHLNGSTAMVYARLRSIDSDWHRVQRQRRVIMATLDNLRKLDITQLDSMLNNMLPLVQTNLTEQDCTNLILLAPEFLSADVDDMTIPLANTYGMMTGLEGRRMFAVDFRTNAHVIRSVIYGNASPSGLVSYYQDLEIPTYRYEADRNAEDTVDDDDYITGDYGSAGVTPGINEN